MKKYYIIQKITPKKSPKLYIRLLLDVVEYTTDKKLASVFTESNLKSELICDINGYYCKFIRKWI